MVPRTATRVKSERSFYNDEVPRVSEEHLAARRQQILAAARACFLRNGFHQTSMQDVIKEAGLSVGAVYRYFPSKNDLITELAETIVGGVSGMLEELSRQEPAPPLLDVMETAVDLVTKETGPDGALRLALQVWSESLRDPALATFVRGVYGRLRAALVTIARRSHEAGHLPAGTDPEAVGVVLLALMPGYALQRILAGGPEPEVFKHGLRTVLGGPAR
jgi:AcrR family transcriptional regulator